MQATATAATGDTRIDALLGAMRWANPSGQPLLLTYSFPDASSVWSNAAGEYAAGDAWGPQGGFVSLSALEKSAVRAALEAWAVVANVQFVETVDNATGSGTLRFAWTASQVPEQSFAYGPGGSSKSGDIWLNSLATWDGFAPGTYGFSTLIHEIGHALGLKHPFEGPVLLPQNQESYAVSLMSYTAYAGWPGSWVDFEPTTPMLYDLMAIQSMYGANLASRSGDDTYVFTDSQRYFQTLWDSGGNDTIIWQSLSLGARIDLNAGHLSQLSAPLTFWSEDFSNSWTDRDRVAIALGVTIENAIGGDSQDTLIGNGVANQLTAGLGDDNLEGGGGDDTLNGGAGNDTARWDKAATNYTLSFSGDNLMVADKTAADGTDTLLGVERLQFADKTVHVDAASHGSYADLPVELYHFFIVAFNGAPGVTYMDQLAEAYRYGLSVPQIVEIFTTKHQFTDVYPTSLSHHDLAVELTNQIIKNSATSDAKAEAANDIQAALDIGWSVGQVIYTVFGNLAHMPLDDAKWGGTTRQFNNEIAVAKVYTEVLNQSTTELDTLRDVLAPVDAFTDVSSQSEIVTLIGQALLQG